MRVFWWFFFFFVGAKFPNKILKYREEKMSHGSGRIVFATSVCTRACDCTSAEDTWAHPPPPTSTHRPLKVPVLLSPENGLFRLQGPVLELATGILAFHQRAWVKRQLCVWPKSQGKVASCISCVMLRCMFRRLPLRSTHHCLNEVIQAVGKFVFFTLFTKSPRGPFWPRGKNFHWFLKDIGGLTL